MAFFGTLCKEGRGRGIVVNIANKTVITQTVGFALSEGQ